MENNCFVEKRCECNKENHEPKKVVITGGPGAGKTAVLEMARKNFCVHIAVLPEAATILFGGGFWRHDSLVAKKAAQRAIFHIQREMELLVTGEKEAAIALCDRGTLDGLAYWPGDEAEYFRELGTTKEEEFSQYVAVIHLRSPSLQMGYNHSNPVRIESADEAKSIDEKIIKAWEGHPHRFVIESSGDFMEKVAKAMNVIRDHLPNCCKSHKIQELGEK